MTQTSRRSSLARSQARTMAWRIPGRMIQRFATSSRLPALKLKSDSDATMVKTRLSATAPARAGCVTAGRSAARSLLQAVALDRGEQDVRVVAALPDEGRGVREMAGISRVYDDGDRGELRVGLQLPQE